MTTRLPNWAFYPGQATPAAGDIFEVVSLAHDVLDLDSGCRVTCVELRQVQPAQPAAADFIVDEPNEYGVVSIWPYSKGPLEASIEVHTRGWDDEGRIVPEYNIRWRHVFTPVAEVRRYALALLKACEIAEQMQRTSEQEARGDGS